MPRRSAYRICLPNFCGLGATSQAMPRARRASATCVADGTALLVGRARPARRWAPAGSRRARRRRAAAAACGRRRRRRRRRGTSYGRRRRGRRSGRRRRRLQPLVAGHEDLDDGAGVVVEAARDPEVGLDGDARPPAAPTPGSPRRRRPARPGPRSSSSSLDAERADPLDEARCRPPGSSPARGTARPARASRRPARPAGRRPRRRAACRACRSTRIAAVTSGDAEPAVEALDQLAVVELEGHRRAAAARRAPRPSPASPRRRGGRAARPGRRCRCRPG